MSWGSDARAANRLFRTFSPEITNHIGGKLVITELAGGNLAGLLDTHSGIDALHILRGQIRGVAIRVQWDVNYKTFTIRYRRRSGVDTEYDKRISACRGQEGWLYPYLTIQAYATKCKNGTLMSYAIANTTDLYRYLDKHVRPELIGGKKGQIEDSCIEYNVCPEGNTFLTVNFNGLKDAEIRHIFRNRTGQKMKTITKLTNRFYRGILLDVSHRNNGEAP